MGAKLGGGKNGDITTNSKKNKKVGGMSFQNTLRLKNDNVRGGADCYLGLDQLIGDRK